MGRKLLEDMTLEELEVMLAKRKSRDLYIEFLIKRFKGE